jgi:hypothetical protein
MAFAAIDLPGEFVGRGQAEFDLGHLAEQAPEAAAQFVAIVGGKILGQQGIRGGGPELQQCAPQRQSFPMGKAGEAREFLSDGISAFEKEDGNRRLAAGDFDLAPFGDSEHAVQVLRLDGEKLQFQRVKLAGAEPALGAAGRNKAVAGGELGRGNIVLQPIAKPFGNPRHEPAVDNGELFGGRLQRQLLQYEVLVHSHQKFDGGLLPFYVSFETIVKQPSAGLAGRTAFFTELLEFTSEGDGSRDGREGGKAPNSNLQAPEKHQARKLQIALNLLTAAIGCWNLEVLWCLDVDAWCFRQSQSRKQ